MDNPLEDEKDQHALKKKNSGYINDFFYTTLYSSLYSLNPHSPTATTCEGGWTNLTAPSFPLEKNPPRLLVHMSINEARRIVQSQNGGEVQTTGGKKV